VGLALMFKTLAPIEEGGRMFFERVGGYKASIDCNLGCIGACCVCKGLPSSVRERIANSGCDVCSRATQPMRLSSFVSSFFL
jgi:hypothetical protein